MNNFILFLFVSYFNPFERFAFTFALPVAQQVGFGDIGYRQAKHKWYGSAGSLTYIECCSVRFANFWKP